MFNADDLIAFAKSESKEDTIPLDEIVPLLLSLTALRLRLDVDVSRLAEIICEAMNEGEYPELRLSTEDQRSFLRRLTNLLDIESLLYPVKGPDVITAHEHVFAYARIISDIRPIFGSDIKVQPAAAAIVHTLQLTYHEADGARDFYVAMDQDDLSVLGDIVDRARLKADSLLSLLKKMEITVMGKGNNCEE
jgi:hypothetical protein